MAKPSVEDRLSALERELDLLKQRISLTFPSRPARKDDWLTAVSGSFKYAPEFDEVLKLGRLARASDFPDDEAQPRSTP